MESNVATLSPEFESVKRYLVVTFLSVFLTVPLAGAWGAFFVSDAVTTIGEFIEVLFFIPGMVTLTVLFGWIFWIPVAAFSFVIGRPIWNAILRRLLNTQIPHRLCILIASGVVVILTCYFADLFMIILDDYKSIGSHFVFVPSVLPFAAIVACGSAQLLYGPKK